MQKVETRLIFSYTFHSLVQHFEIQNEVFLYYTHQK